MSEKLQSPNLVEAFFRDRLFPPEEICVVNGKYL